MALTDTTIRNAKPQAKPYKLTDEKGLFLLVQPSGGKLWRFKFRTDVCSTFEAFKAWSQNMGHTHAMTTLTSYGTISTHRQAELIRGIAADQTTPSLDPATWAELMVTLQKLTGKGLV